jgi:hypothetical protein
MAARMNANTPAAVACIAATRHRWSVYRLWLNGLPSLGVFAAPREPMRFGEGERAALLTRTSPLKHAKTPKKKTAPRSGAVFLFIQPRTLPRMLVHDEDDGR